MEPARLLNTAIIPALAELERFGVKDSPSARRFLLAIALQESGLQHRRQVVAGGAELGPASGFWQFERGGGCKGALAHRVVGPMMLAICEDYNVQATDVGLWVAMQFQDIVAAAAARLLVYTLPGALPENADEGWAQYLRAWRPGRPHPESWPGHWATATAAVGGL